LVFLVDSSSCLISQVCVHVGLALATSMCQILDMECSYGKSVMTKIMIPLKVLILIIYEPGGQKQLKWYLTIYNLKYHLGIAKCPLS